MREKCYPAKETAAAKHERIAKEASRLFRERGFENLTLGDTPNGSFDDVMCSTFIRSKRSGCHKKDRYSV